MQMIADVFCDTFMFTAVLCAGLLAIVAAVALTAAILILCSALIGWAFDRATNHLRKAWLQRGSRPKGRWADAIARGDDSCGRRNSR